VFSPEAEKFGGFAPIVFIIENILKRPDSKTAEPQRHIRRDPGRKSIPPWPLREILAAHRSGRPGISGAHTIGERHR
jgi:hypothetical protein